MYHFCPWSQQKFGVLLSLCYSVTKVTVRQLFPMKKETFVGAHPRPKTSLFYLDPVSSLWTCAPSSTLMLRIITKLCWKLTNSEILLRQETGGVKLTKCRIPYGGICGSCWRLYFLSPVILRWTVTMHKNWVTKNDIRPALGPPLPLSQLERAWNNSRCNNPCNQIVVNIELHLLWLFLFLTNIILIRYILDAGKKDRCMREK